MAKSTTWNLCNNTGWKLSALKYGQVISTHAQLFVCDFAAIAVDRQYTFLI
jgi:hypothetical protein